MENLADPTLERAALEKRCWVRLTFACNNRCRFCHDSVVHDGSSVPVGELKEQIRGGLAEGATRLILSGGEPTIHASYLDLVAFGKAAGYGWVQTITNGRMFSYPGFTARAVAAGLDEVTLSMHGHTPALHDALVGVDGAFEQSLAGLANLQRSGRVVISVDVVLNARNLPVLPELVDFYLDRGVHEFDLLWLIPFGRAWANRDELTVRPGDFQAQLQEAVRRARARSAVVWTNRLPAALLEGAEDLIQEPHKLHDEVRGRRAELERWVQTGCALRCRLAQRCESCFMEGFCEHLQALLDARTAGRYPALALDLAAAPSPGPPWNQADSLRISGGDASEAAAFVRACRPGPDRVELVLTAPPALDPRELDWGRPGRLARVASAEPAALEGLLDRAGLELEIILDRSSAGWTESRAGRLAGGADRLSVSLRSFEHLSEVVQTGIDPRQSLVPLRPAPIGLAGIPICLAPWGRQIEWNAPIGPGVIGADGGLDLAAFTDHFIRAGYRVFSVRCAPCPERRRCPGLHVNLVRRFGFCLAAPKRLTEAG